MEPPPAAARKKRGKKKKTKAPEEANHEAADAVQATTVAAATVKREEARSRLRAMIRNRGDGRKVGARGRALDNIAGQLGVSREELEAMQKKGVFGGRSDLGRTRGAAAAEEVLSSSSDEEGEEQDAEAPPRVGPLPLLMSAR